MKTDRTTRALLFVIAVFLGMIALRPWLTPTPVRAQTQGQYGFLQFRGEWIVDGQPGVTAVDMRNGHLWHLVAQNPSNSRVRPAVPMRPATYMGRYGFELVQENPE